jgi:hypothetical protein
MGTLTLTFRGPFLFVVPPPLDDGIPSPFVHIYAPQCAGHLGSVFFGDGAYPIYGRCQYGGSYTYRLTGVNPPDSGIISYQWDYATSGSVSPILSPDSMDNPPQYAATFPTAYFHIRVPRPKIFYALNTVNDTDIVTGASIPDPSGIRWLTAFRLYYDWDAATPAPIRLFPPVTVLPKDTWWDITPPVGGPLAQMPEWLPLADAGDIEFQYEGPVMGDPDHQDASACFNQLAKLAGLPWWLSFNSAGGGGAAFRTGSDCLALSMVLGTKN